MFQLTIEGRGVSYEDVGKGQPVLLLHGFPFSSESFWPQLAAPPKGWRLIAPDLRGFGKSQPVPGVSTMDAMAADALALLDALKVPSAVVGGVSMGGYVAIALTRRDPGRVKGLMLFDTQSAADDEAGRARREAVAKDVEAKGMTPVVEAMMPKLFAAGAPKEAKARIERIMRETNPQAAAAASRGMGQRIDGKDILSRYAGPCLIVVGAEDVITPPERSKQMHDLVAGSRLETIVGAGHLANLEKPTEFNAILGAFLAPLA